jgi:hypothetical protein
MRQRGAAAGGNAHRALASDQQAFDLAIVLDRHGERHECRAAGKMNRRDLVAGVMQDVARLEFDRLEVRREQFEIRAAELLEKIVLGPTGHMSCSGRESAMARTLRFRDGDDGSKVHTRRF